MGASKDWMGASSSRRAVLAAGAVTSAGALTGGLAGCSSGGTQGSEDKVKSKIDNPGDNFNRKGFPIVDKPVTFHFMTGKRVNTAKEYNKVASWKKYQKLTNVRVDWGLVPDESLEEKRNLALSGGDYPEALYGQGLSNLDLYKYARQGVFIKLNDLIDEYMPNVKKILSDNSSVKKGMTFPDGAMYGLPNIHDPKFLGMRIEFIPWVRRDWLDRFDMDVPKTTDEYHRYLKAIKTKQPNGKEKSLGYIDRAQGARLMYGFMGSFGIGNRGTDAGSLDADPDDKDKVRFYPIVEGYRALLEYMHKLYKDGLVAKNVFSIDQAKLSSGMAKGSYGSTVEISPGALFGGKATNLVAMPALKGPQGHHAYNNVGSPLTNAGQFVITDKAEHLAVMGRWIDYFYSDEGTKLFHMGVEGKSYKETKHGPDYLDKIKHAEGLTQDEALKPYVTYMGGLYPAVVKARYFKGIESSDEQAKGAKVMQPDAQPDVWPSFTYSQDEAEQLNSLSDDIDKYVSESRDKFITGDKKLSDWKKYVDKIKQMGLDDYMEIQQAAYDRYRKG